jgi:hypothetical protein
MRSSKQLCHRDPSGVLGCLPDQLAFQPVNGNATLGNIVNSAQFMSAIGMPAIVSSNLSLVNLAVGPGGNATAVVPVNMRQIATDLDPSFRGHNQFYRADLQPRQSPKLGSYIQYPKLLYSRTLDFRAPSI